MPDTYLKLFETNIEVIKEDFQVELVDEDIYKISPKSIKAPPIAFVGITHGEEVAGLHILNEILFRLIEKRLDLKSVLYLVLGNRKAYLKNQRYIDVDLNRSYHVTLESNKYEEKRALKIKNALRNCHFVVDFHQTVQATLFPFFIMPSSEEALYSWVSYIGSNISILQKPISKNITTLTSYINSLNRFGITLEVGDNGFDAYQIELGAKVAENIINSATQKHFEISNNRNIPQIYDIKHHENYLGGNIKFTKKFINFETVLEGQIIAMNDGIEIKAPMSGHIILYPEKWFQKDSTTTPEGLFIIASTLC